MIVFLLLLLSFVIYGYAPQTYSYSYNLLIFITYIIVAIYHIKNTIINGNFFNFHILFSISFLFVNFVYPVFIYPIDPEYFPVFRYHFNHNIITKASALALIGFSSYAFGATVVKRQHNTLNQSHLPIKKVIGALHILLTGIFILILIIGGAGLFTGIFGATKIIPPGLLTLFQVVLGLTVVLNLYAFPRNASIAKIFRGFNKWVIGVILLYFLIFILVGDRGPIIQITLISICAYALLIKNMSARALLTTVALGMITLTFISYARTKDVTTDQSFIQRGMENTEINSFLDVGMDLIINNRNLYVGYEYANVYGLNYGKGMFYYIFAPFPYVPSFLTGQLYNSAPADLTSAAKITDDVNATYGLGTNMIADQYMEFGLVGVLVLMFLLGYTVEKLHRKASKLHINSLIAYSFLVGISIYLPRTSVLEPIRFMVWGIVIYNLLTYLLYQNKTFKNNK